MHCQMAMQVKTKLRSKYTDNLIIDISSEMKDRAKRDLIGVLFIF